MKTILYFCVCFLLWSCFSDEEKSRILTATGGKSELLIVMDTMQWSGQVGEEMRAIFAAPMPCMLRGEKFYNVRPVPALAMKNMIQSHRNLIVLTTFDRNSPSAQRMKGFFTDESIQKVLKNDSLFMLVKRNQFAQDQLLVLLFGKDEATLLKNLRANREQLFRLFYENDIKRQEIKLTAGGGDAKIQTEINKDYGVSMFVPKGYQVAKTTKIDSAQGFVWLRQPDNIVDKNLVLAYKPYTSEKQFEADSILAWREKIAKTHLFGNPDNPDSYVITENLEPPVFRTTQNNGAFAVEMRGLWKTNNVTMGGSFISYVFPDVAKGRICYVEGFIYAPSLDSKRESIKEMEVITRLAKTVAKQ